MPGTNRNKTQHLLHYKTTLTITFWVQIIETCISTISLKSTIKKMHLTKDHTILLHDLLEVCLLFQKTEAIGQEMYFST